MTKVILLTGATGFVGRQVLRTLATRDVRVRVVVRSGKQDQVSRMDNIESLVPTADLFAEDAIWWTEVCRDITTVIHVAWYAEHGKYMQSAKNLDCLSGTLQMAKGAANAGVQRFVGIGSCSEYDVSGGLLSIDTALRPTTPYASAKAAAFMALAQYLPQQGIEFAWCRLFYVYGEAEDPRRLVPYLRAKLLAGEVAELTSGNQLRDFLDVAQAGQMIVDIALGNQQGPINVCSGIPTSVRQFAEAIADEYGRRDLLKFGARADNLFDPLCVVGLVSEG